MFTLSITGWYFLYLCVVFHDSVNSQGKLLNVADSADRDRKRERESCTRWEGCIVVLSWRDWRNTCQYAKLLNLFP